MHLAWKRHLGITGVTAPHFLGVWLANMHSQGLAPYASWWLDFIIVCQINFSWPRNVDNFFLNLIRFCYFVFALCKL